MTFNRRAGYVSETPLSRRGGATIFDVAAAAGVSIATVSRYVNESGYVSEENRRRIAKAIQELDFTPSVSARSLNTRRSHLLGFVVSSIAHPFSAEVARGIQDIAVSAGYVVSVSSTDGRSDLQVAALRTFHAHRVDAVIVTPPESPESDYYLERLARRGTVVVLIGRHLTHPLVDTVTSDTRSGATAAMTHLIELGHRRIAYLGGPQVSQGSRFDVYRQMLIDAGSGFDQSLARATDLTLESGYEEMRSLLGVKDRPSAVFCIDDLVAIGALQAAKDSGFRVPEDLSIVGFDDDVYARLVDPPLTTVAQPSFDLGRSAARRALLRLEATADADPSDALPKETIRLPCALVIRGSTGPTPPASTRSRRIRNTPNRQTTRRREEVVPETPGPS